MGLTLSRIGSDPYYANYEKSLARIQKDVIKLKAQLEARRAVSAHIRSRFLGGFAAVYVVILAYAAWVARAPPATYTYRQHLTLVAPALYAPPAAWLLYRLLSAILQALDSYSARKVALLDSKLRKMVAELKESSRYERTLALLKKYDPEYKPPLPTPAPRPAAPAGRAPGVQGPRAPPQPQPAAGPKVVPALTQLWTRAADRLIADDPVALRLLQEAQREAAELRAALVASETETLRLQAQNRHLLTELGVDMGSDVTGHQPQPAEAGVVEGNAMPAGGEPAVAAGETALDTVAASGNGKTGAAGSCDPTLKEPVTERPRSPARKRLV
ncbi:hypothetical protein F751_1655 [Auxenochlorella protothecoides]|uniref:Uncharacterized protein n=1 Tax=Auxenochlorella protothecoides TaxID=3075 RepID=A0A087SU75_AUXPR|nr:hypothetical protein F751_1655 [Auxenochlorella protothecoides]KFM29279.1 hypothetical protein F751_1655 [Auxenochlorella protothecoides]